MGGSAKYRSRFVYYTDANGRKRVMRDENGKPVKVGVRKYTKRELQKLQSLRRGRIPARLPGRRSGNEPLSLSDRRKNAADVIERTQNPQELQSAMESLGLGMKHSYLTEIKDFESAKQIAAAIADMNEVFGSDVLGDTTTKGKFPKGTQGYTFPGDNVIHLNPKEYGDVKTMQTICDFESRYGYSYKNQTPGSIVKHEFAHLLQNRLCKTVMNSETYKNLRNSYNSAQNTIDRLTADHPKEWAKAEKWLDKAAEARTLFQQIDYTSKAMAIMKPIMSSEAHSNLYNAVRTKFSNRNTIGQLLRQETTTRIQNLFMGLGYTTPGRVATALTGNSQAYAKKNWQESHAECIADYMTNGNNASPVSIAYVQAFAKEIGISLE